jgi:lathosterol oxidase
LHTSATNVAQPRAVGPSMIGPSTSPLLSLAVGFALVYAILLSCYFGTCLTVTWLSCRRPDHKIQKDRQTPPGQIKRDIRASISSLAAISFLFTLGAWFHYQFGWGYKIHQQTIANTVVSFGFSMLVFDTWFYWFHRLLHTRWFFKHTHRWHHLIRTPVVWSNDSDTLADNCFLQSYWAFAYFMFPISPIVLLAHKIYDLVTGCIGHSGYEYAGRLSLPPSPLISVTHHDQHHRYSRCNYATHFTIWDRLMGTLCREHDAEAARNIRGTINLSAVDSRLTGQRRRRFTL